MGEDDIHDRHDAEYLPDISRLFKLLEHMLDVDYLIAPGDSGNSYADEVTLVGKSVREMLDLRF